MLFSRKNINNYLFSCQRSPAFSLVFMQFILMQDVVLFILFFFCFIFRVVEFASMNDMQRAIKRLDGTELMGKRIRLTEVCWQTEVQGSPLPCPRYFSC